MKQQAGTVYRDTEEYQRFLRNSDEEYRERIKNLRNKKGCLEVFDAEIDAITNVMKAVAAEQYTMQLKIQSDKRCFDEAELESKRAEKQRLNEKLKAVEHEIARLRLKKVLNKNQQGGKEK